jgi:hypothetical protein
LYVGAAYVMANATSKALSTHDLGDYTVTETFTEPLYRRLVKSGSEYNYKVKLLKPGTEEQVQIERGRMKMVKEIKEIGELRRKGKTEEVVKRAKALMKDNPVDRDLIKRGLNNAFSKVPKHAIVNDILFTKDPAMAAEKLYRVFDGNLVDGSLLDEEQREWRKQLFDKKNGRAVNDQVLSHYKQYVEKKGKK